MPKDCPVCGGDMLDLIEDDVSVCTNYEECGYQEDIDWSEVSK